MPLPLSYSQLRPYFERLLSRIDDRLYAYIQPRRRRMSLMANPFIGWGTPERITVRGRVVAPRNLQPPKVGDHRLRNFLSQLRRLLSREVSGVAVRGTVAGQTAETVSDRSGYYTLEFALPQPLSPGWHEVNVSLPESGVRESNSVLVVGAAAFGVISDIDDTVLESDVTSLPRMLSTALTGNALTRLPFPGVGALYRALQGTDQNPIFYVSSSPWNFFDLLKGFLHYRRIPLGPLLLRDWGLDLLGGHGNHKAQNIEQILDTYPDLRFVLIGDSGEEDPEIYAEVVRRHPGRVLAVYIREVGSPLLRRDLGPLAAELREHGVDMILSQDSYSPAKHAMALGLIRPSAVSWVLSAIEKRDR